MDMRRQNYIPRIIVFSLVVIGLLAYVRFHKPASPENPDVNQIDSAGGDNKPTTVSAEHLPDVTQSNRVFRVRQDQTLASINGTAITLRDLFPIKAVATDVEQEIAPETYEYFLKRAIDRELTVQAAKAQGITLTESQSQQLAKMQGLREQPEPGLLQKFTVDAAQIQFELRDAQAFMLQNNLLAQQGSSPNVTADQVQAYYQMHVAELGELPSEPEARQAAWQTIDINIRGQLAAEMRSKYQKELKDYLDQLRARANISIASLPAMQALPTLPNDARR